MSVDRDVIENLQKRIANLESQIKAVRNNSTPTVPLYDPAQFPIDSVEGQIALGTDGNTYKFQDGTWSEIGGGGASTPLQLDYFSTVPGPFGDPSHIDSTVGTGNWLKWTGQSDWSGYPNPYIDVDTTTGTDSAGRNIDRRFIYLPTGGTLGSGGGIVKVEFSLLIEGTDPAIVWDVRPVQTHGTGPGGWSSEIGSGGLSPYGFVYGFGNDFPAQSRAAHTNWEKPSMWWYHQMGGAAFHAIGFEVIQYYPGGTSADYTDAVTGECVVTIVKDDAFAGGRF